MNSVCYTDSSSTFSYVLMAGLVAMQMLHAQQFVEVGNGNADPLIQRTYLTHRSGETFNNFTYPISGEYDNTTFIFERAIGDFYATLLGSQEPLGTEFEKILYDNLWDLYES